MYAHLDQRKASLHLHLHVARRKHATGTSSICTVSVFLKWREKPDAMSSTLAGSSAVAIVNTPEVQCVKQIDIYKSPVSPVILCALCG
jgi:hypothetical protein